MCKVTVDLHVSNIIKDILQIEQNHWFSKWMSIIYPRDLHSVFQQDLLPQQHNGLILSFSS